MTASDIVLISSASVQLLAILGLAVSVWSLGQRIGSGIDGLSKDLADLSKDVVALANDVAANTLATERLAARLDEHTRHHL